MEQIHGKCSGEGYDLSILSNKLKYSFASERYGYECGEMIESITGLTLCSLYNTIEQQSLFIDPHRDEFLLDGEIRYGCHLEDKIHTDSLQFEAGACRRRRQCASTKISSRRYRTCS